MTACDQATGEYFLCRHTHVPSQIEQYLLSSVIDCPTHYCYLVLHFSWPPIHLLFLYHPFLVSNFHQLPS